MPFPQVRQCLLCEEVRSELGNKISILGFFGILPDVQIGFPIGLGVAKVVFLLVCGGGAVSFQYPRASEILMALFGRGAACSGVISREPAH